MGEWDFVADAVTAYDNAPKTKKVPFDHHKFYAEEQVHHRVKKMTTARAARQRSNAIRANRVRKGTLKARGSS